MRQLELDLLLALLATLTTACAPAIVPSAPPADGPALGRSVGPQQPQPDPDQDEGKPGRRAEPGWVALEVPDGEAVRTLWLDPGLVVEFAPTPTQQAALLSAVPAAEEAERPTEHVRLWRMPPSVDVDRLTDELNRGLRGQSFSPVLRLGTTSRSPICALPGGVLAWFPADWDAARVERWLGLRGAGQARRLEIDENAWAIAAPAGLESVRLAARLWQSGDLTACAPDLWQEAATR